MAAILAGGIALAATGVAGAYAYSQYASGALKLGGGEKSAKKKKKKQQQQQQKDKEEAEMTPIKSRSGKKKAATDNADGVVSSSEGIVQLQEAFQTALKVQNEANGRRLAEMERLMKQISENNQQKYELLRSASGTDDLKTDIQTIKQILLTRQTATLSTSNLAVNNSATEPAKDKEEESESLASAASVVATTPPPASTPGLKPWEMRRRNRLAESSPALANSPAALSPAPPSTMAATPAMTPTTDLGASGAAVMVEEPVAASDGGANNDQQPAVGSGANDE